MRSQLTTKTSTSILFLCASDFWKSHRLIIKNNYICHCQDLCCRHAFSSQHQTAISGKKIVCNLIHLFVRLIKIHRFLSQKKVQGQGIVLVEFTYIYNLENYIVSPNFPSSYPNNYEEVNLIILPHRHNTNDIINCRHGSLSQTIKKVSHSLSIILTYNMTLMIGM